jgi:hypothetical protein
MSFPINLPATATVIPSLPYTITDDFGGTLGGETWFVYTATALDIMIGLHVDSDGGGGDNPILRIYSTIGLTATIPGYADTTQYAQMPTTPGVDYYIKLIGDSGTANITLSIQSQPNLLIETGQILTPDPSRYNFPPVILSFDAEDVTRVPDMVGANTMDRIADGTMCLAHLETDFSVDTIYFYGPTPFPTLITMIAYPVGGDLLFIKQDYNGTFFLCKAAFSGGSPLTLVQVSAVGAILDTWTLPGASLISFAANVGGTIAYWSAAGVANVIAAYDLVNDTPLADFAAGIADYRVISLTVLSDDSLVASYKSEIDDTIRLIRYNAAGAVQATLEVGPGWFIPATVASNDYDATKCVLRTENTAPDALTLTKWWELNVADLSVHRSFVVSNYDNGEGRVVNDQYFGPGESSDFILLDAESSPCVPGTVILEPAGSFTLITGRDLTVRFTVSPAVAAPTPDPDILDIVVNDPNYPDGGNWEFRVYSGSPGDTSTPLSAVITTQTQATTDIVGVSTSTAIWIQAIQYCDGVVEDTFDSGGTTVTVVGVPGCPVANTFGNVIF